MSIRLGPLILQICAVLIAGAVVAGGYVWYREREVERFEQASRIRDVQTFSALHTFLQNAPAAYCRDDASSFQGAARTLGYHYKGKSMFAVENITTGRVEYSVVDETGMYFWASDSKEIYYIPVRYLLDAVVGLSAFEDLGAVVSSSDCEVWWRPDERIFRIPANLPIIEYGS